MTKVVRYDGPETFIMSYLASYFRPSFLRSGQLGSLRKIQGPRSQAPESAFGEQNNCET